MFFLMKWREKWSEILSRARGFPDPFFLSGHCPYIQVGTAQQSHALHWGVPQTPFFHQGVALWGIPPNPIREPALGFFHQPQPLLHKKGLRTTPQAPRQSLARGCN